jgi:hypothetical protein
MVPWLPPCPKPRPIRLWWSRRDNSVKESLRALLLENRF